MVPVPCAVVETPPLTFRDKALAFFRAHLGEPYEWEEPPGFTYRWVVRRAERPTMHIYVTLNSPEFANIAHILIADPCAPEDGRLESLTLRREEEFEGVMAMIRARLECP